MAIFFSISCLRLLNTKAPIILLFLKFYYPQSSVILHEAGGATDTTNFMLHKIIELPGLPSFSTD